MTRYIIQRADKFLHEDKHLERSWRPRHLATVFPTAAHAQEYMLWFFQTDMPYVLVEVK